MLRINKLSLYVVAALMMLFSCSEDLMMAGESTGQGGSMTRFAINGNYMYIVSQNAINVFDIHDGTFEKINTISVDFGLETIFARGEYLYLGANDAMYIYGLSDPEAPSFIFRYAHIFSCDPVVVQGDRAYVTLRGGGRCSRDISLLEIIDITNRHNPMLIASYPMTSPYGLGVDGKLLFLCEGEAGLKIYDITVETNIALISSITDKHAYDVIPRNGLLQMTGEDGIFQYQYDQTGAMNLLSTIPVIGAVE